MGWKVFRLRDIAERLDVSVILPCYNERGNIVPLVSELLQVLEEWDFEILVVDDNSPDGTADAIREAFAQDQKVRLIVRTEDRGLAKSVRAGIELARGDIVVVMDTDFNHDPAVVPLLCHVAERADIVIGSRFIFGGGMVNPWRYYASYLYNIGMRLTLGTRIDDNLSGLFAASRARISELDFDKIFFGYGDYFFRLLLKSQERKFLHIEVPAMYGSRLSGTAKTKVGSIFVKYSREVLRVLWMKLTGKW